MYNTDFNRNENFWNGLYICQNQSSSCEKCERAHRFEQLLSHLTLASKAENYEERISTTVVAICADEKLMAPLQLILPREFDERKHIVDSMAQKYLQQASKSVQHLVPIKSVADGNCLFNSIISLLPDSNLSAVELRVRTVIELVKNKIYYVNQCSNHVGPFEEALRRTCNNNTFSELYEIVALANVLQCEVQSVYPYIDYRAEMKIMNQMYKSAETLVPNSRRVIIFWSSTEDEISTRTRPGNHGIWNPNHFVPLLEQYRSYRTEDNERVSTTPESPRKATSKNSPASFIQSLEFSPPPNTTKHKDSAETYFETIPVSQAASNRSSESEDQRNARLTEQRKRSALNRLSENEDQRNAHLTEQRKRSVSNRSSEINEINIAKLPEDDVPESIWTIIERIENAADGDVERAGCTGDPLVDAVTQGEAHTTNIFPITASAILDVNGTTIASKDIGVHLLHKIKNSSSKALIDPSDISTDNMENEDVYVIPRSNMPVNDCANPEFLLGLFPTLFPYGCGAPYDSTRPSPVSLNQHIRYLLAYEDQRFEKHHSFMFVLFNIMQRRQACWNASLMASRPYFQDTATDLQTLTSKEIETALISATSQTFSSITNPRVNMLMKRIRTVGGNVMGSAYSRASLRTQIHALIFNQGLPSIFMTINPADIHSRVALYFAGVDLDLDTILPEKIPSTYERAQIIASHRVATARFFNVLISSILKCMVEKGVLGPIKAYFGTVENQGRGSLHLHILMWLDHDLTLSQLKESVKNEEFRNGLLGYLEDIIKQDLSNFDFDTSETDVPERQHTHIISNNECAISTTESNTSKLIPLIMPTPKPSMPNFALHFKNDIVQLVNSNNIHKHTITCYKYSKKYENPTCRMRMPRRIENVSSINIESGEIKLKRLHETINNFNEYIISACRSNMDIKYIFSGSDAKALVYYITDYVTKSNLSFHDTFSLVLKAIQSLEKQKLNIDAAVNAEEKSRRLVLRCYNILASQQELSGVQVASYLMGWPDHYTTHEFVNLFLILGLRIIYRQH
ncbi:unnamed protein product [Rotaria socialis]|uniref:ATP-dependent DNA helicase n=1 Tax=Rotaria socialis TaxID=392032 RepID=A0A821RDW9_9BILA|nr:unnamed protein product [Rotaria socialis]